MSISLPDSLRDALPHSSRLAKAIREAADAHPAVVGAPLALRAARKAHIVITANAMADVGPTPLGDGEETILMSLQLVDEAAISLAYHQERLHPVHLCAIIEQRHKDLASRLANVKHARNAGYGSAEAIARSEAAIGRVIRMRLFKLETHERDEFGTIMTVQIVGTLMRTCGARGIPIGRLNDAELMELVEDAYDASLPQTLTEHGKISHN